VETFTAVATITVGSGPHGIAILPSGAAVYVASFFTNTVSVIDTATNAVTATIPVGKAPCGVAMHPQGSSLYVTNTYSSLPNSKNMAHGSLSVIDTATNTVTATVPLEINPRGVAVHPSGTSVYVADFSGNTVSVLDISTNKVTATITVGDAPFAFGQFIGPDRGRAR